MSTITPLRTSPSAPVDLRKTALKKKEMSITQTYFLAHKARAKLSREAAQPDHDLRLLVGHANLLDNLMVELADAEREQERWFNQSVRASQKTSPTEQRRVQWADRIVEEPAEDDYSSDSDTSDDDFEDDDVVMATAMPVTRTVEVAETMIDDDLEEDDLEEDYAQLELVRTPSHSTSPPELIEHDLEDSSEDESMPPSPPQPAVAFAVPKNKTKQAPAEQGTTLYKNDYYLQPQGLVTAISVY